MPRSDTAKELLHESADMVTVVAIVGLVIIVAVHTLLAAVLSRFFRIRLETRWGAAFFTLIFVPIVLVVSLLVLGGVLGLGGGISADRNVVLTATILVPFMLGYAIDHLWMPSPDEVARELERSR